MTDKVKRQQLKTAKSDFKTVKYQLKKERKDYRRLKLSYTDMLTLKDNLEEIKQQYKTKKKQFHRLKKQRDKSKQIRYLTMQSTQHNIHHLNSDILQEDEVLSQLAHTRIRYLQASQSVHTLKKFGEANGKSSKWIVKKIYELGNRAYNTSKGRGFVRTPHQLSWHHKFKQSKYAKTIRGVHKSFVNPLKRMAINVLKNPFSLVGVFNACLLLFILSPFFSVGVVKQNEFDLTDTWTYFTKLDRERSTHQVMYYSDIDDYLFYINYRYDTIADRHFIKPKTSLPDSILGRNYLEVLWEAINSKPEALKTMKDLYTVPGDYYLTDKEQKDYQAMVSSHNEIGKYASLVELSNFLSVEHTGTLKIIKRYGYEDKETLSEISTFKATPRQELYAPLTGVVTIEGDDVIITTEKQRITFKQVVGIRVRHQQSIKRGEFFGQVKATGNQDVLYEKKRPRKHGKRDAEGKEEMEWKSVNIGFYLPRVVYTQKTSVMTNTVMNSQKASRARQFVQAIKQRFPEATHESIAAILGNFDIESEIKSKMAEGDYLSPPIGKTDEGSYDNDSWLSIGGMDIYGKYPNILKRGIGLGQWTDTSDGSTRHTLLREYAKSQGKKWYDMDLQVDFMANGDTPFYRQLFLNILSSSEDVSTLTEYFLNHWEGNPGDKLDARVASARSWLAFLNYSGNGQPLGNMQDVVMTSHFGEFRQLILQDGRFYENTHNGVDLVYKDGRVNAPVYAVEGGDVIHAQHDNETGLTVVIKHEHYYSYYFHLSSLQVTAGQRVESGMSLGTMGSTGHSTGVHLHLGFSRSLWADYFDPKAYLQLD
ncbi:MULTISPECIES: phage tail tip lysozyme [unclassified Granulicatella]|uniref:phage tail tip lysozyme n=1 Tax=unclassified Granulicatella TaxID=2630493 RepID=UPI001073A9D8|nr:MULTISPECIES: phage tail tip lysozyme [unclassified Granulicatella]MBF0780596.1 peptidoglycan DD-metalloendopeptidase family protein [Granulicatella sp. 19428wC4_WM01]TFU94624.1 M23 family metallopeptidase [Granulicatella sp. WM01]